jgi:hypothetical protein
MPFRRHAELDHAIDEAVKVLRILNRKNVGLDGKRVIVLHANGKHFFHIPPASKVPPHKRTPKALLPVAQFTKPLAAWGDDEPLEMPSVNPVSPN